MKYYYLLTVLLFAFAGAAAQSGYKVSLQDLKTLEGTYAYTEKSTLQIAASPRDTMLYALIGTAKYKLRPFDKDIFLNSSNQQVQFVRLGGKVVGYKVKDSQPDKVYKRLSSQVSFSDNMWYPRPPGTKYRYRVPAEKYDGLSTRPLTGSGLDTALISRMIERIMDGTYPNVHSILLVKDGKLVLEEYFYEYDLNKLHELRSASKTFVSALVGVAVDQGFIKGLDDQVTSNFPQYQIENNNHQKRTITIRNMLTQQSGLACNDRDPDSPGNETKIYPTGDWIKTVLDLPMDGNPGEKAQYCSGNTMVLGKVVERSSKQSLHDFADKYLFSPLGTTGFKWDFVPDQDHQEDFGQLYLKPRDMAKFGLLYLNGGKWKGKQIIPEDYVSQSLTRHSVVDGIDYGYLWWCESLTAGGVTYKGMAAKGNGGQRIFLWPEQNMVAVITAGNYNTQSPANKMLIECVLAGLKKK
jgi:CubicO group peptidase (beta-lactamase class C family)